MKIGNDDENDGDLRQPIPVLILHQITTIIVRKFGAGAGVSDVK